jgi:uncharacterized cupredoxin-like copper-binding protein
MFAARRLSMLSLPLAVAALVVGGCASDDDASGTTVQVTSTDDACEVATAEVGAGSITFEVRNDGSDATEVYIFRGDDKSLSEPLDEVEDIGPGTSRDMAIELEAGDYQLVCKPGQTGDGIRAEMITVTESGGGGY